MVLKENLLILSSMVLPPPIVFLADTTAQGQGRQSLRSDGCQYKLVWMLLLLSVLSRRVKSLLCCREIMIYGYQL